VNTRGEKLGEHAGIHHYTVGQRRGLGIAVGHPVYVVRVDAASNTLVVGPRAEALGGHMRVDGVSWTCGAGPAATFRADVQIRYNHAAAAAEVCVHDGGTADVKFHKPQFAIAPGQWAVFYDGDRVLGGGWIVSD